MVINVLIRRLRAKDLRDERRSDRIQYINYPGLTQIWALWMVSLRITGAVKLSLEHITNLNQFNLIS